MNIAIRLATPADAPAMAEIHMRSWEVAYKDIIPADFIREKNAARPAQWQRIITAENTAHYVIQADGKTAGFLHIAPPQDDDLDDNCYELCAIYLHPYYFRQGIGTQAMEFAFDKARDLGKTAMTVWVLAENANTIHFYEKCGFDEDGKTKEVEYGRILECVRMCCDLQHICSSDNM